MASNASLSNGVNGRVRDPGSRVNGSTSNLVDGVNGSTDGPPLPNVNHAPGPVSYAQAAAPSSNGRQQEEKHDEQNNPIHDSPSYAEVAAQSPPEKQEVKHDERSSTDSCDSQTSTAVTTEPPTESQDGQLDKQSATHGRDSSSRAEVAARAPSEASWLRVDLRRPEHHDQNHHNTKEQENEKKVPAPVDNPEADTKPPGAVSYAKVAAALDPKILWRGSRANTSATPTGSTGEIRKRATTVKTQIKQQGPSDNAHDKEAPPSIRFAPIRVPLKRRMQTLMVLVHCMCLLVAVPCFFFICANPLAWPFLVPYLLHVIFSTAASDGSLTYRSEWFRSSSIWKLFADYFPATLHKTHDLPATRKYIFGYHPHGIISHGAWAAFATEALGFAEKFPGIKNSLLTLDSNFNIPLYREYILAAGIRSVSKESITNHLTRGGSNNEGMGRAVTIVIGGARESLEAHPGRLRLILKDRMGFIRMAMRTGADLVPVLAFGENDLYDQLEPQTHPKIHKLQMFVLKVWKFTLPFMHGRGIFNYDYGLMPYRRPLNIVVGQPIPVVQSSNNIVNPAEVERVHGLYCQELERLWDDYKDTFAKNRTEEMQMLV